MSTVEGMEVMLMDAAAKTYPEGFTIITNVFAHGTLEDGYDILIANTVVHKQFAEFGPMEKNVLTLKGVNYNSPNNKDVKADMYLWKADYGQILVVKGLLVDPNDTEEVEYAKKCQEDLVVFI